MNQQKQKGTALLILVAALGYFVDVYDLTLFGIVRIPSLTDLGISDAAELKKMGEILFNWQMGGMLIGGIIWGIIGDKKGRLSVLFGSIIMYSCANIANGFIHDINTYKILRLIAGIGLAGELGAGVALVSETMSKEKRGYGTMLIASIGVLGAVTASLLANKFNWRTSYFIGGGMGLALLLMRFGLYESGMFEDVKKSNAERGNFFILFKTKKNIIKYSSIILMGVPIWFTIGIYIYFSKEIGQALGMQELPNPGKAIMYNYIGLSIGDLCSGALSQILKSRKKAILVFLFLNIISISCLLIIGKQSLVLFYGCCIFVGFTVGYWAIFNATAAEQFGTNIRATVSATSPNFVRGSVILITLLYHLFEKFTGDIISASICVGIIVFGIAFIAIYFLEETFGKDLNYSE